MQQLAVERRQHTDTIATNALLVTHTFCIASAIVSCRIAPTICLTLGFVSVLVAYVLSIVAEM